MTQENKQTETSEEFRKRMVEVIREADKRIERERKNNK